MHLEKVDLAAGLWEGELGSNIPGRDDGEQGMAGLGFPLEEEPTGHVDGLDMGKGVKERVELSFRLDPEQLGEWRHHLPRWK